MLQDRYVAEFIEKYEHHNLQGYNSGGYAYLQSHQILNNAANQSEVEESAELTQNIKVDGARKPSLKDRLKNIVGMKSKEGLQQDWRLEINATEEDEIEIANE